MLKHLFKGSGAGVGHGTASADVGQTIALDAFKLTITSLLAEGGFGCVYIAEDDQGKQYALKKVSLNARHFAQNPLHSLVALTGGVGLGPRARSGNPQRHHQGG
jgi:hypothetical protein